MNRILTSKMTCLMLATSISALTAFESNAVTIESTYDWKKAVRLEYRSVGVPTVENRIFGHAWAISPPQQMASWYPLQPRGPGIPPFDPWGVERQAKQGPTIFNNKVPVNFDIIPVPPGGKPLPMREGFALAVAGTARGYAESLSGPTSPVEGGGLRVFTGEVEVNGFAEADQPGDRAYAASYSDLTITARGVRVAVQPQFTSSAFSGVMAPNVHMLTRGHDPISLILPGTDPATGMAYDPIDVMDMTYEQVGEGMMEWSGLVTIDAQNASFLIDVSTPFSVQQGRLELLISDGIVAVSDDSGMFDGLLPSVGHAGPVVFSLSEIALDLDLSLLPASIDPETVTVDISHVGFALVSIDIPEPSTICLMFSGIAGLSLRRRVQQR